MPGTMRSEQCGSDNEISATVPGEAAWSEDAHRQGGLLGITGPYVYEAAGCQIHVAKPHQIPELWTEYLSGALTNYRRFGVESVLEFDTVLPGRSTSWFFAAVDTSGAVIGGMRVQGPYLYAEESHAMTEWAGRAGDPSNSSGD